MLPASSSPENPHVQVTDCVSTTSVKQKDTNTAQESNPLSWIEIDAAALQHNIRSFRRFAAPTSQVMGVVKANAYGHGLLDVAACIHQDVDWWGVNSVGEALQLRRAGYLQPILVMNRTPASAFSQMITAGISQVIYDVGTATQISQEAVRLGLVARVHLKLETGTRRQGIWCGDAATVAAQISALPHIEIEGAYTHFADAEDAGDDSYFRLQLDRYESAIAAMKQAGIEVKVHHTAATAAGLRADAARLDVVRFGIGLYGLWPSTATKYAFQQQHGEEAAASLLYPVLSWRAKVVHVHHVPRGEPVGYSLTYCTRRGTEVAVVGVGYSDGYDRGMSNGGIVVVKGQRVPVIGRVMMNMILLDVTDVEGGVHVDDIVTLIGEGASADEMADRLGTINYEVVTRLSPLLTRKIV